VEVAGLAAGTYDVYVYVDGDNRAYERTASYTISSVGAVPLTSTVTDLASTNFAGKFIRADNCAGNYLKFTITGSGFTLSATPTLPVSGTRRAPVNGVQIVPVAVAPPPASIGIKFNGSSATPMDPSESAGVVVRTHWNNGAGATRSTPLALVDDAGVPTQATVTWTANGAWMTPIVDQPGNFRLMKGYLDTSSMTTTTVTVSNLAPGCYDVYMYVDGDNHEYTRTAAYTLSGPGIATATVNVTDPANVNFAGTFIAAASSNGNYVRFSITGTDFTLTAKPVSGTNPTLRAPVNAVQIVPK
jgi:hypothetical protein